MSNNESNDDSVSKNQVSPSSTPNFEHEKKSNDVMQRTPILWNLHRKMCDLASFFFREIIFAPPTFKLIVTFSIIIIGSLIKKLDLAPQSYFSSKKNILNIYFAKLGWGWTISLLAPFIYITLITTKSHYEIITRHLVRLLIATGIWYLVTLLFVYLEEKTGSCQSDRNHAVSRKDCPKFELSGHTFLLLYAVLIIKAEVKSYDTYKRKLEQILESNKKSLTIYQEHLKIFSRVLPVIYVLLAIFTVLWEFIMLTTALYFHEMSHKIIAGLIATGCWYITYHIWYCRDSTSILRPFSPTY